MGNKVVILSVISGFIKAPHKHETKCRYLTPTTLCCTEDYFCADTDMPCSSCTSDNNDC
jgi:hypothetical protein